MTACICSTCGAVVYNRWRGPIRALLAHQERVHKRQPWDRRREETWDD